VVRITVRPARPEDFEVLREIEQRAGERFRDVGLDAVADDEPPTLDTLAGYAADGRAWVATDDDGTPIGYTVVDAVDGCAHIEQMSVRPDHQGTGVGRTLLGRVRAWAAETNRDAVTLTTFSDVPWNRPLYEHWGFQVLADAEIGPGLSAVREAEAAHDLDPAMRVCMRLDLTDLTD
jgi:GNAT superfamily N-acetyltransferase